MENTSISLPPIFIVEYENKFEAECVNNTLSFETSNSDLNSTSNKFEIVPSLTHTASNYTLSSSFNNTTDHSEYLYDDLPLL